MAKKKTKKVCVKGAIVSNDNKWIYDWFGMEATAPMDVTKFLDDLDGDDIVVEINSGGGDIFAGSEIYTTLRNYQGNVEIQIVGLAASAASVIAMAGPSKITPTGLFMIHNVSSGAQGDHNDLEQQAMVLKTADTSIANAYKDKTGLSDEELLSLMDKETWLNAQDAVKMGFVDEVLFAQQKQLSLSNGINLINDVAIDKLKALIGEQDQKNDAVFLMQKKALDAKLKLLKLKGDIRNEI